ncbi:TnsA-like heteromeric transposase endonuclease subunit [Streptomyces sp. ISL-100]|uniref:TnsA-like heteromeric transposase endonuclease subunit n=1 Tax=Streptomyces sp. ISL-100 TaxID=2819173 RepID=UPI001BEA64C4|nr:TnsA-like heteromeric transposase endonuclease subunit [Streptomyces sp. ISL-100]MBT2401855.1 TnsA-like heteromeric transposase endonuclease subunit [Streptomyces sp. ISL-100]
MNETQALGGPALPSDTPGPLWSHRCSWTDLLVPVSLYAGRGALDQSDGWADRWTATWKYAGDEVTGPVRHLGQMPVASRGPMRGFTWRRDQRHRPGLGPLLATGRLHGFESLEEDQLLVGLDFAGDLVEVLSQPLRIRFRTGEVWRKHTPDFFAVTRMGTWLIDVRPRPLIKPEDLQSFAAAAEVATVSGWHYAVAGEWRPHVRPTLGAMYARRRPTRDVFGLQVGLLAQAEEGVTFGELAAAQTYWPVARAHLLHLLWHRRLGVDLSEPLTDRSRVVLAGGTS